MTYNVHRCVGVDRKLDVERIAGLIAEFEPDVVCLQELDVGRARTGGKDQAQEIAKRLSMSFHFNAAMRVEKELYGDAILNTHLGLVPREQRLQAAALVGRDWLGHAQCVDPTILVGDFNATSVTRPYQRFLTKLRDAQKCGGPAKTVPTFPSAFPVLRIDHVFVSPSVRVTGVQAPFSPLARMASDHLPLIVDFELDAVAGESRSDAAA
jgi:endonuclease/exonuclease/phosphatase family metal-dependent hydrolase